LFVARIIEFGSVFFVVPLFLFQVPVFYKYIFMLRRGGQRGFFVPVRIYVARRRATWKLLFGEIAMFLFVRVPRSENWRSLPSSCYPALRTLTLGGRPPATPYPSPGAGVPPRPLEQALLPEEPTGDAAGTDGIR
jgi:hypothetical protein